MLESVEIGSRDGWLQDAQRQLGPPSATLSVTSAGGFIVEAARDGAAETNLGLAEARVPVGTHVCQIFSDDEERDVAMLRFLCMGLQLREKSACFSEKLDEDRLAQLAAQKGADLAKSRSDGSFQRSPSKAIYLGDGRFDPERMLSLLAAFDESASREGFKAARLIGEMDPDVLSSPGGEQLIEYEARVSMLLRTHPVTTMCQYDARSFDGATIMDVLRVHPMMVVRDMVVRNPFFVQPEEVLSGR